MPQSSSASRGAVPMASRAAEEELPLCATPHTQALLGKGPVVVSEDRQATCMPILACDGAHLRRWAFVAGVFVGLVGLGAVFVFEFVSTGHDKVEIGASFEEDFSRSSALFAGSAATPRGPGMARKTRKHASATLSSPADLS